MLDFTLEDLSAEDVERLRHIYRPLTESVRELIDATIRTAADAQTVAAAKAQIDAATAALRTEQLDGPFGVQFTAHGPGNVVPSGLEPSTLKSLAGRHQPPPLMCGSGNSPTSSRLRYT